MDTVDLVTGFVSQFGREAFESKLLLFIENREMIIYKFISYFKSEDLKTLIYLFGCVGSSLQHTGSLIFVVACRIFSWGMWDLVP